MRPEVPTGLISYAAASVVAAAVAATVSSQSGALAWLAAAFVVLGLAVEFLTLPRYERNRSCRPVKRLLVIGGTALLVAAAFEWSSSDQIRGALGVVVAASAVVGTAAIVHVACSGPKRILLVGGRIGVGQLIGQWGPLRSVEVIGVCLAEFVDGTAAPLAGVPVLGSLDDVAAVAEELSVDQVVVAAGPLVSSYDVRRMSWALEQTPVELSVIASVHGAVPRRIDTKLVGHRLLLSVSPGRTPRASLWLKGAFDRVAAALLLILLSPLLLILMVAIRLDSPGPALFRQTRTGRNGRTFTMLKFRTMVVGAESMLAGLMAYNEGAGPMFKMAHDPRTTRLGRLLRRTSLDELPQLLNVLAGDMSLVGPRPCLPREAGEYDEWERRRLSAKPGITGAWQVHGRSDLSWQDSVRLDVDYADNRTLHDDLLILARTARVVAKREGAL